MKYRSILLPAAILSVSISGCGTQESKDDATGIVTRTSDRKVERVGLRTATATVQAIDQENRRVTLKGSDGSTMTFVAGDEVRNLAQVKQSDVVVVSYYESLVLEAKEPGQAAPGASVTAGAGRAAPGEKPGAAGAREIRVTTKVLGVDRAGGTITLESAGGEPITVKAQDPKNLEKVKAGDLLEITYTEALAISVEKAPAK